MASEADVVDRARAAGARLAWQGHRVEDAEFCVEKSTVA